MRDIFFRAFAQAIAVPGIFFLLTSRALEFLKLPGLIRLPKLRHDSKSTFGTLLRYLDIHEDDELDEAQFSAWVKQASQLPGERM